MTIPLPKLSPAQLAEIFWLMNDSEQGLFFDELGQLALTTPSWVAGGAIGTMSGLDWQMYCASREATPLGRDTMSRMSGNGTHILKP